MNEMLLLSFCFIIHIRPTFAGIIIAGCIGALSACLVLVYGHYLIHILAVPLLMIRVLLIKRAEISIKKAVVFYLIWFFCAFSLGGFAGYIIKDVHCIYTLVSTAFIFLLLVYFVAGRRIADGIRSENDNIYELNFIHNDKEINAKGYFDSGNSLYEPISGAMVFLGEIDKLYPYLTEGEKKYIELFPDLPNEWDGQTYIRSIPYASVGNERGHLPGIPVSGLKLQKDKKCRYIDKCYLGIYSGKLSKDKSYDYLLQKEMKI